MVGGSGPVPAGRKGSILGTGNWERRKLLKGLGGGGGWQGGPFPKPSPSLSAVQEGGFGAGATLPAVPPGGGGVDPTIHGSKCPPRRFDTHLWGKTFLVERTFSGPNLCSGAFGANIHCYTKQRAHYGSPFLQPPPPPSAGVRPPPPRVAFRRVAVSLRGPGQSPVLPFACCVGSLRSVGRCGRCSCWCRFRVRGAQWLACWGWCWLLRGSFDCFCCPHTSVLRPSITCFAAFPCA